MFNIKKALKKILKDKYSLGNTKMTIQRCSFCKDNTKHFGNICTQCYKVN